MRIYHKNSDLTNYLHTIRTIGDSIGFVPTMGALHQGHLSLIQASKNECAISVVSIFVNPTQFNNKTDFELYPRDNERDISLLQNLMGENDCLFLPSIDDIYSDGTNKKYDLQNLDKTMEGEHRPGHFNGVAMVVARLFDIVKPHKAFFGQKDFQQLAIIKFLAKYILKQKIDIIECPTIRESSGLAMSSRNTRLNSAQRSQAALLSDTLFKIASLKPIMSPNEVKIWAKDRINASGTLNTEYVEIVNAETLVSITNWNEPGEKVVCLAAIIGGIRLIDNLKIS